MILLSPHFPLADYERTATGLPNALPPALRAAAVALHVRILEPWRARMGASAGRVVKVRETSGYRSEAVNIAVHGSRTSQHKRAQAADCAAVGCTPPQAFVALAAVSMWVPLGQGIYYPHEGFCHVSIDLPPNHNPDLPEGEQPPAPAGWAPRRELWVCVDPARKAPLMSGAAWLGAPSRRPAP